MQFNSAITAPVEGQTSEPQQRPVWIDDHDLGKWLMLLPKDADTAPASYRFCTDPYTRARVNARLAERPEGVISRVLCRLCQSPSWQYELLPVSADAIAHHMKSK